MHNSISSIKKIASHQIEEIFFKNSIDLYYERRYYVSDDDDEQQVRQSHLFISVPWRRINILNSNNTIMIIQSNDKSTQQQDHF